MPSHLNPFQEKTKVLFERKQMEEELFAEKEQKTHIRPSEGSRKGIQGLLATTGLISITRSRDLYLKNYQRKKLWAKSLMVAQS